MSINGVTCVFVAHFRSSGTSESLYTSLTVNIHVSTKTCVTGSNFILHKSLGSSVYCMTWSLWQWVNGQEVMHHEGGHLPFEETVNPYLKFGQANRVTVAVNNTLTPHTLPPGSIEYMTDKDKWVLIWLCFVPILAYCLTILNVRKCSSSWQYNIQFFSHNYTTSNVLLTSTFRPPSVAFFRNWMFSGQWSRPPMVVETCIQIQVSRGK